MNKVIVFAGTTEGREICSFLKKYEIASLACTATEYGKCRIEEGGALTVRSGRLTEEEMEQLFGEEQPEMVIDATHPYADLVSENIRSACEKAGKQVSFGCCGRRLRQIHPASWSIRQKKRYRIWRAQRERFW